MQSWLEKNFKADEIASSTEQINWQKWQERGIKVILFDLDNTLSLHGTTLPDSRVESLIQELKSQNFIIYLLSNAKSKRGKIFAQKLDIPCLGQAKKPSPKAILTIMAQEGVKKSQCLMVGDQILTDIWAAKRAGIASVLVAPISEKEAWWIRFKRCLERMIKARLACN